MNYHDLLAQPGIDFVVIATPDHQHKPHLLAALDAGKDVYQEKPLSLNLAAERRDGGGRAQDQTNRANRHAAPQHAIHAQGEAIGG